MRGEEKGVLSEVVRCFTARVAIVKAYSRASTHTAVRLYSSSLLSSPVLTSTAPVPSYPSPVHPPLPFFKGGSRSPRWSFSVTTVPR